MANPLLMAEIFDNINEGIYILNRKGDYIYCNNAFLKMVGATREEALRLNAFQLIPEGQVSVSVAVTAFTEKKKVSVVNNVLTPKGYHYRQLATATPIFGSGGEVEYMLVETVRLDLLAKRYQQAILYEDDSTIEVPALSPERTRAKETIIADSPAMQAILQTAAQVAQTDSTVLISGETGTGKEVLAKYIHRNSSRADAPIIEINCAALPENLLEAELFGYTKGAFTGALNTGKPGLIEAAHGGTLFLDEINSLPLALQGKFLRWRSRRSTSACWPPPTRTSRRACWPGPSGRTFTTASTSFRWSCPRCGSAGRISPHWPPFFWTTTASATAAPRSSPAESSNS